MAPSKAAKQGGHTAAVLKHFLTYPKQHVTVEELAEAIEATPAQVGMAVNYAIKNNKLPGLKVVQGGHIWYYDMPEVPVVNNDTMEVVRRNEKAIMLMDEDGTFWIAKRVEV